MENNQDGQPKKTKISEERREYLRVYYQQNKDRLRAYQREYNATHKRSLGKTKPAARQLIKTGFTPSDLMHAPVEKTLKILEKILKGERELTM